MTRRGRRNHGHGGGGARSAPGPSEVSRTQVAVAWLRTLGSSMSIAAFVDEVGGLVGNLTLTVGDKGHSHVVGPLSAHDKRGLREEAEDAPEPFLVIVVRRDVPAGWFVPAGTFVRNYCVVGGGVVRLRVEETKKMQTPTPRRVFTSATSRASRTSERGGRRRTREEGGPARSTCGWVHRHTTDGRPQSALSTSTPVHEV